MSSKRIKGRKKIRTIEHVENLYESLRLETSNRRKEKDTKIRTGLFSKCSICNTHDLQIEYYSVDNRGSIFKDRSQRSIFLCLKCNNRFDEYIKQCQVVLISIMKDYLPQVLIEELNKYIYSPK